MGQRENSHFKYVVLGFGVSGKPSYKLLKKLGFDVAVINSGPLSLWRNNLADESDCFEQGSLAAKSVLAAADYIVLSPGIPRGHESLKNIKAEIINDIELFYRFKKTKPKIVAITGSNGKTTTVTMLDEILRRAGKSVFCGGNIGKSPIEFILEGEREDIVLLELSSFQLETVGQFYPDIAGILNIQMTHEERYQHYDDYQNAKLRILRSNNTGQRFYTDQATSHVAPAALIYDSPSVIEELKEKFDFSSFKLPGEHNILNLSMCVLMARDLGVEDFIIQDVINNFSGVKDRIEFVGEISKVKVFNDSKSTNVFSTATAINAFQGKKVLLLLGGQIRDHKNINIAEIEKLLGTVFRYAFFGELAQIKEIKCEHRFYSLNDIDLKLLAKGVDVILFSPGFPSFDEFSNYVERGNCFRKIFSRV